MDDNNNDKGITITTPVTKKHNHGNRVIQIPNAMKQVHFSPSANQNSSSVPLRSPPPPPPTVWTVDSGKDSSSVSPTLSFPVPYSAHFKSHSSANIPTTGTEENRSTDQDTSDGGGGVCDGKEEE